MDLHYQLNDEVFASQFEQLTLPPEWFTHEAHLRLAWIHLKRDGAAKACQNIPQQIKSFAQHWGAPGKFNLTVTIAAIKAVQHFMQKSHSDQFQDFIAEFPRLKYNLKDLLGFHYSFDIFGTQTAKTRFLAPDLLPFD